MSDNRGPVEQLIDTALRARRDWWREDLRRAIATAIGPSLVRLMNASGSKPEDLATFVKRVAARDAIEAATSNQPDPADIVLRPDPDHDPEAQARGIAACRDALRRKEPAR